MSAPWRHGMRLAEVTSISGTRKKVRRISERLAEAAQGEEGREENTYGAFNPTY